MANYNEIDVNSTSYQRAKSVHITNEYGQDPFISFSEEIVVELPDNKAAHSELGILSGSFNASNQTEEVALLDTTTGLPTASTITYAEIVNVIRSLYRHMATKRDAALAQLEADRLAAIAALANATPTVEEPVQNP